MGRATRKAPHGRETRGLHLGAAVLWGVMLVSVNIKVSLGSLYQCTRDTALYRLETQRSLKEDNHLNLNP